MGKSSRATPPPRVAHPDWEWITFRVHPKMKVQIKGLMNLGLFTSYRDYFVFLVRQELKTTRVEIVSNQKM
jgi:hypothetical protein